MKGLRRTAERLSRNRVLLRHVHIGGGREPIYVTPDAQLKYMKVGASAFDADLIALAQHHVVPGATVWDVGSNVGTFFVAAAHMAGSTGRVVAVEADPWLASLLDRTSQLEAHRNKSMHVLCAAAAGAFGIAEFLIAERGRASNALAEAGGRNQMGGVRFRRPVTTIPLDHLLETYPAPTLVKIDVEGAEEMVLDGMTKVLTEARPKVYMEIGGEQFDAITLRMAGHRYQCCRPDGTPVDRHCSENYLFLPAEHVDDGAA